MRRQKYFVIDANDELKSRLLSVGDEDFLFLFGESILWTVDEQHRGNLTKDDYREVVKIVFLVNLKYEYSAASNFYSIFPDLATSIPYFDANWSISEIEQDNSVEWSVGSLTGSAANPFNEITLNSRVSEYLSNLFDFIKNKNNSV